MTPEQLDEIEKMADHPDLDDLCDLAAHALPLVKALREAWEIIDQYERKDGPMFQAHLGEAKALMERDEAHAETERLREVVRQVHALTIGSIVHSVSLSAIHKITKGMVE